MILAGRLPGSGPIAVLHNKYRFGSGGGFDLYIQHPLALPIVPESRQRIAPV
jgi:hypothetical protein